MHPTNLNILINMSEFRYLGTTVTNQNLIQEEIKMRLNSGNACYHSVQNLLSSRLLSKTYRLLVGKPEGKRPLERPRWRWVDNISMHLREVVWGGVDWIGLAQDRNRWRAFVNLLWNLRVP
jgi:hypothetical protein